jgi:myo-inositol-1(or 4)-monophosphatase
VPDDFELAASLVREAGLLAEAMWLEGVTTESKTSVSDVVTNADHAAEELIVRRLRAERPLDGLVGEEGAAQPGTRTWFIDPIDGTYNFSRDLPIWCSAIALADAEGAVLGAIFDPNADELWLGGRGRPTTCNGVEVTPDPRPLSEISVASYLHPTTLPDDSVRLPLLRAISTAATVRMMGSGSVELAAVAAGRLGCFVQSDSLPWDWLPGSTLVVAAGGAARVIELDGHRWHVAGSAGAVDEVCQLLRG